MKKIYISLLFIAFAIPSVSANLAGGDISVRCISGLTYEIRLTIVGHDFSPNDSVPFYFGDNTSTSFSLQSATSISSLAPLFPNDSEIIWVFLHNYPGPGSYTVLIGSANRNCWIVNIPNSCSTVLILEATIAIDPNIGCNSSPVCTSANFIESIAVSSNNSFNLGAIDINGDSLSYSFIPCIDTTQIVGYTFPNILGGGTMDIDSVTGDFYWNQPLNPGLYNLAIAIDEWKLFPNGIRYKIGTVMREIEFSVGNTAGISEQKPFSFSFFPNPISTAQELHFQFEKEGNYFIQIYNAQGKVVFEHSVFYRNEQTLLLPTLSSGIYFIIVRDENQFHSTQKISIQNP